MTQRSPVIYLASPDSDQAFALYRLLKDSPVDLRGAWLGSPRSPCLPVPSVSLDEALADQEAFVIPTNHAATGAVLAHGDLSLPALTFAADSLKLTDKQFSLTLARRVGIPVPNTWSDSAEIPESVGEFVFFKEAMEAGGGRRGLVRRTEVARLGEGLIFQEYIASQGTYGVAFVASSGTIHESVSHFEVSSQPRSGGSAVEIQRYEDARLNDYTARLVNETNYDGWGLAEFKWCDRRQDFVFMEVNAKMWASCEYSFRQCPQMLEAIVGAAVTPGERPSTIFFLHRAFLGSPVRALRIALSRRSNMAIVCYPIPIRSIATGLIPHRGREFVQTILKELHEMAIQIVSSFKSTSTVTRNRRRIDWSASRKSR